MSSNDLFFTNRAPASIAESTSGARAILGRVLTKDEDYFYNIKIPRRVKYGTTKETSELWNSLMNKYPDSAILPYVKPLRVNMGFDKN